jgi:hypothetical protein
MGGANFDLLHWRRLWEPHFPELWHERGLFPSFQAPPSTVSLRTRASKHPIEQPPQPLDRSSLNLQNPERSSSLEAPRAFTRHWSSRRSCPRATTRGQATTISEIILPSIYSDQDHHQRIDRPPIYRSTVEKTPTEKTRASTRYRRNRRRCSRAPAPPHGLKPRTRASRLQNSRKAAISDSSPADLPFGGGTASIGGSTRLHAPMGTPASPFTRHRGLRTQ